MLSDAEAAEVIATLLSTISMVDGDATRATQRERAAWTQRGHARGHGARTASEPNASSSSGYQRCVGCPRRHRAGQPRGRDARAMRTMSPEDRAYCLRPTREVYHEQEDNRAVRCAASILVASTVTWLGHVQGSQLASTQLALLLRRRHERRASFPRDGGEDVSRMGSEAHR